jgi:branched-chain amino acid transport system substrate-binding protein
VKGILGKRIEVDGVRHPIQVIIKDSRSDPNRASEAAAELILCDKADMVAVQRKIAGVSKSVIAEQTRTI